LLDAKQGFFYSLKLPAEKGGQFVAILHGAASKVKMGNRTVFRSKNSRFFTDKFLLFSSNRG